MKDNEMSTTLRCFGNVMIPVVLVPMYVAFVAGWIYRMIYGGFHSGANAAKKWCDTP